MASIFHPMKPTLSDLASAMVAALPQGDLANYVADLAMFHASELKEAPTRPANAPYYGQAFADALAALKLGHTHRITHHLEFLAKAVKKAGGVLQEKERVQRVIGTVPQPTDRKDGETARVPRTGKE